MTKEKGIALTEIASQLKINARTARAKMRRRKVPKGMTVGDTWVFTAAGVKWAKEALKTDMRKAA